MGTKVQGKSYYPGYYSMRNLNNGADSGSWSLYPEDAHLSNGIYYNGYIPRPTTDGYVEYDKDVLKKTILQHDAIFRNQVFELHRLYRIQMELMHQLKRKEVGKYPMMVEASQSSPVSSLMPFDDVQNMWHLPPVKSSCTRASVFGTEDLQSASGCIKVKGAQISPVSIQKGSSSKDGELLEPKSQKRTRRMIDLQLPADEYIDCEEGKVVDKEKVAMPPYMESNGLKRSTGNPTETDVNLFLGSGRRPSLGEHASKLDSCIGNKHHLADLNEPIQIEEMADSVPANFPGPVAGNRKIQGMDMPGHLNSGVRLPYEMFQNTLKGENSGAHVSTLQLEKEGNGREWLSNNLGTGQSRSCLNSFPQGFRPDNLHAPFESTQVELRNAHAPPEYAPGNHIKKEPWSVSAIYGIESSNRNQNLSNHSISGYFATPCRQSSQSFMPQSDVTSCGSSVDPSWMTPLSNFNQKAIAVQALPCFETSKPRSKTPIQRPVTIAENGHLHGLSKTKSGFGSEASTRNGYSHWPLSESKKPQAHFPSSTHDCLNYDDGSTSASERYQCSTMYLKNSNCRDVKTLEGLNLNLSFPNVSQEQMAQQQDVIIIDREVEKEDQSKVLHWLRPTIKEKGHPKQRGLSFLQNCSPNIEKKELPTPSSAQDFTSVSCSYAAEPERPEVGECPSNKKITGVPLFGKFLSVDSSCPGSPKSLDVPSEPETIQDNGKAQVLDIDLSRDLATSDSCQPRSAKNGIVEKDTEDISVVRNHFNLNLCLDEEEAVSATATTGTTCKIDLEAPVVPETTESITPGSQSPENQLVTPIDISQVNADAEELNRIAAEAIVLISSSPVYNTLEEATCPTSVASLWDSLNWFSGVISNMNDLDSKVEVVSIGKDEGGHEEPSFDGIDYFEYMTLKLTETKEDEYWCTKPWASDFPVEEEKSTSVLLTRRRRGQGRRGRQRKDFQRDILPGLVSLSRHEVTEDLQIIGGLMRATGCTWQTGSSRRNAARNGCARGRKRTQGPVSPVTTLPALPPRQQLINIEVGVEDQSLKGWGKTTRRPRRQRYAAGNPPIPVTQA